MENHLLRWNMQPFDLATDMDRFFDGLRYSELPWFRFATEYGVENAIDMLIIWFALNKSDQQWLIALVHVFGAQAGERATLRRDDPIPLSGRFLTIKGDDYPRAIRECCDSILNIYEAYLLYDP
jgi:hypothetical protein